MLADLQNLKTSEIELRQELPVLECEWLAGRLLAKQGVAAVRWAGSGRFLVEHDADVCDSAALIAFLQFCGAPAAVVRVGFVSSHFGSRQAAHSSN